MRPSALFVTCTTLVTLIAFAGNSVLCRLALVDGAIDPASFTAVRVASGAAALGLLVRATPSAKVRPATLGSHLPAALALFAYALCFSLAYVTLDAGTGALLLFGAVQVTMIGVGLGRGERLSPRQGLGFAVALVGVLVLLLPGVTRPHPLGALLMIGAGSAWGLYSLLGRGVAAPTRHTARNFALATPFAGVAFALSWAGGEAVASTRGVLLALGSGAVTSGLGYSLWYAALRGHSRTSASIVQLAVPVLAALVGALVLDEAVTTRLLGAGGLTLAGIACASVPGRPGTRNRSPE